MKKLYCFSVLFFIACTLTSFGQNTPGFKYQTIVRNHNNEIVINQLVSFRMTILQSSDSGIPVYRESFQTTTNPSGLVTFEIGKGVLLFGSFKDIKWYDNIYFLKIEFDPAGGTNFQTMGISQLVAVPYSYVSQWSRSALNDQDTSATNELQTLSLMGYQLSLSQGNSINLPEGDSSNYNEIQLLSFSNDTLFLTNGGYVALGKYNNTLALDGLKNKIIADSLFLKSLIDTNTVHLNDEITIRLNEDQALNNAINNESIIRTSADASLLNNLNLIRNEHIADSTALYILLNTISGNLNTEVYNRMSADTFIYNKALADSVFLKQLIDSSLSKTTNEIVARKASDILIYAKMNSDSTYFTGLINNNVSAINTETSNRLTDVNAIYQKISADSTLFNSLINTNVADIVAETANRIAADNSLNNKDVADSSLLRGLINTNAGNISSETTNRTSADNQLQTTINTLKSKEIADSSYLKGLISSNSADIATETASRTAADNSLKNKDVADSSLLRGLINTNASNISSETTNRTSADNQLQANINTLKSKEIADSSYLKGLISSNTADIATETASRIAADNSLKNKDVADSSLLRGLINTNTSNISSETTNRTSADNQLQTNINTLKSKEIADSSYLKGLISTNSADIATETASRIAADNSLKNKDVADSSLLRGLINTNASNISSETTNRTSADNQLQTNINTLKSKEIADSSYLKGLISSNSTAISTETTNRTNADNTLQSNLTSETNSRISSDNVIKNKMSSDSLAIRTDLNTVYGWGNHATAGYLKTEVDGSVTNELQALSISNDTLYLSNGGYVKLPSPAWSRTGNSGTDSTINFIGTTDGEPLVIKTNNTEQMRVSKSGKVGIGTQSPNAVLDISSTSGGLLIPRMTTAQRDLISSPALGLQIYNTSTKCFNIWNGSSWGQICPDCGFTPVAGNNGPICAGLTLNLTAATITGAAYSWTGPNGFTSTLQNPVINNATTAASGAYYVTATLNGCTSLASTTVATVNPSFGTTSATYNNPVCVNGTLNLSASVFPGASYTWSGPNNYFSNLSSPSISNVQMSHAGSYYVVATAGGCSSNDTVVVTVYPVPAQPGAITGTSSLLPPKTGISYSIAAVSGATSYTWAYSGSGATITGQGTNSITVDFACGATSGVMSVTANNICGGASSVQTQSVTATTLPQPGVITGTTPIVPPQTGTTYSIAAVTGATSYTWTVPASLGSITSGQGSTTITVDFACGATAGLISVVANNSCGSSISRTLTINIASLSTPGTISGPGTISYPQNGVAYSIPAVSGASTYTWTVPSGATVASGQGSNSITVNYPCGATSGNISVTASNTCGSSGANNLSVTITTVTPATPGAISGTNNLPMGVTGVNYSISAVSGASTFTWTVPTGASITAGQGTSAITVNYSCTATSGNVSVTAGNGCGTSSARTLAITVNAAPDQPGAITGITSMPQGTTGIIYSITNVTGATSYTWSYSGTGATIVSGQGTTSVTVDLACTATNGNITVNASNACSTASANRTLGITMTGTLPAPGAITGTTTPLFGQTSTPYSVAAVTGATTYTWSVPTGATITSGQGTNAILVDFGCSASNGNVSVTVSNSCIGAGTPRNLGITLGSTVPQPGTISGLTSVPQGYSSVTYSIAAVTGATTYSWSYTGSGGNIVSGQGTNSIVVDYACSASSGNISVTASNSCAGPSTARTLAVTVNALATPGTITGQTSVPKGSTGINYYISPISGATSYTWIVPLGATVVYGQGTTSVWVDYSCTASSGNILVTSNNACGSSGGSSLNITITTSTPAAPGGITTAPTTTIPKGLTGVTHSIAAVTGASSYTWTVPTGASITSGQGSTAIVVDYPCHAVSGNVSVTANNTCGSSTASSVYMTVNAAPSQPGGITGSTTVQKGATGILYYIASVPGTTYYTWSVPTGAAITSGQGTTEITVDFPNFSCTSVSGNITVNTMNSCGNVSSNSALGITINSSIASLGVITGTTSPLYGQAATPYSVVPITGATTYTWSVPSGATISSGQGTPNVGVDFSCSATNGTIIVSASNPCVSASPVSLSFALSSTALTQPGAITGLTSVPRGTTSVVYSIAAVNGATSYTWSVPTNCTISSGQGTKSITVDFSNCSVTSGNISVSATNACVTSSPSQTLAVSVTTTALATPGAITGLQTPVSGQKGVTYSIAAVTGATSYTWSYSGSGVSIISGQGTTSITVDYACGSTNGNINVTASNSCVATSAAQNLAITVGSVLATPGVISGIQGPVFGQKDVTYSIANVSGASGYKWTLTSGASISSGQGTNTIKVDFSCTAAANGTISVTDSNSCIAHGTASALSYAMSGSITTPGTIGGLTSVPKGTSGVDYSVSAVSGAASYTWSVPSGCSIISGQGTNSIKVDYGCSSASGNITVTATNSCTTTSASNLAVTVVSSLATPGTITGSSSPGFGSAINYSVLPVTGATSYNWSAPTGAAIVSGSGTNSVWYSFSCSASSGNISVTVNNSCIAAGTARTLAITPATASSLGNLGSISEFINNGTNSRTYSVVSVGAAKYVWTVPSGITIISGQGGPSININYTGTINGTIRVIASNSCLSQSDTAELVVNFSGSTIFYAVGTGSTGYIQTFTVPSGVTSINIETWGAQGGNGNGGAGGLGARMKGSFSVTPGQVLKILVGQKGLDAGGAGGGGGSFITDNNNNPFIIAGGGGTAGNPGLITTSGGGPNAGSGGSGGTGSGAGSGGGFSGDGSDGCCSAGGGKSYLNGGNGGNAGSSGNAGGYGGGGGGEWCCCGTGGAGGGYSGGGISCTYNTGGGGGGSYNAGTNQSNTSGVKTGDGKVVITW